MAENEPSGIDGQVEWNMAALVNLELAKQRSIANEAFLNTNMARAVRALICLRQTAEHTFTDEETTEVDELQDKMIKYLNDLNFIGSFNDELRLRGNVAYQLTLKAYSKYNTKISKLLDKYGFYGGRKKDASRMVIRK